MPVHSSRALVNGDAMSDLNPLNGRKTELIWEGKYDEAGRRVVPLRVVLPFQMVETVNETAQERQKSLSLFETPGGSGVGEWRNRLVWGDKNMCCRRCWPSSRAR